MVKSEGRGIQSIEIGNRLLLALMRSGEPMMLRDLAVQAEIGPAQAHAYLASFRRVDLVEQETVSGRYILGPATNRLASARMAGFEPLARVNEVAPRLAHDTGLMIALLVWGPQAPTTYRVHDASSGLNINLRQGTTFSVINSAGGRIFAAFDQSGVVSQRIKDELAGLTSRGAGGAKSSQRDFEKAITVIKRNGFARLENSPVPGLSSLSVPILEDGKLVLVVTAIGPTSQLDQEGHDGPKEKLLRFAKSLT